MTGSRQRSGEYMSADMGGDWYEVEKLSKRASCMNLAARSMVGGFLPQKHCNQVSRGGDLPAWSSWQPCQGVLGGRRMNRPDKHSSDFGSKLRALAFS